MKRATYNEMLGVVEKWRNGHKQVAVDLLRGWSLASVAGLMRAFKDDKDSAEFVQKLAVAESGWK